jgi:acetyl esterase/lipase
MPRSRSAIRLALLTGVALVACGEAIRAADAPGFTRKEDVVYGRKFGTALTMDVIAPEKPNGLGVIFVVSGGWFSSHESIQPQQWMELTRHGYTVFEVVHGSQPKFTIPEILEDMHRAVRFIRHNAAQYGINPDKIGITGLSAGGHLSLMQAVAGKPGDESAKDPVDRESSRVQVVACFFPPTDFLNYGKPGENAIGQGVLKDLRAAFDFREFDPQTKTFAPITDQARILEIGKNISPIAHISPDDPPTLILHGDADTRVPFQQATSFIDKLKAAGVPANLVTKPGAQHGWPTMFDDMTVMANWFDKYLLAQQPAANN